MISIKVLGPGCARCVRVAQLVKNAIQTLGLEANIEKVTEMSDILKYRILATPGLVINEKIVCAGRIPGPAEVETWLADAGAVRAE